MEDLTKSPAKNNRGPDDYSEVEKILAKSAEHNYRIIDTIAAFVDSPLFREASIRDDNTHQRTNP